MTTDHGTELTKEEIALVKSLERLAKKWSETPNRLWLFSGSGTLWVMMDEDEDTNPTPRMTVLGGVNQQNIIIGINGIPNDGGDWD